MSFLEGKRILFTGNSDKDYSTVYLLPDYPCKDPAALTCHSVHSEISLTCAGAGTVNPVTKLCECPMFDVTTGQYFDTASEDCQPCVGGCSECSGGSALDCDLCPLNSNFNGSICVCIGSFWLDLSGGGVGVCSPCDAECNTCSGPDDDECLSCFPPKVLETNSCVDPPPPSSSSGSSGTSGDIFDMDNISEEERINILNSKIRNSVTPKDIIQKGLVDYRIPIDEDAICSPTNFQKYTDIIDGECKLCDRRCYGCTGPTHGDCINCQPGWYMKNGYCEDCSEIPSDDNTELRC